MIKATVLDNSQKSIFNVAFLMHSIDDVIRVNLMRLINQFADGTQKKFAAMVEIDYGLLNQIVNGHKDLGKPLIERICKALNIGYHEFTIEPDTPIITNTSVMKIERTVRENPGIALQLEQVAEAFAKYGDKSKDTAVPKKRTKSA